MCERCTAMMKKTLESLVIDYGEFFMLMGSQSDSTYDDEETGDEDWLRDFLLALREGRAATAKQFRRLMMDSAMLITALSEVGLDAKQSEALVKAMTS